MTIKTTLPTDSTERKNLPVLSGALKYAPAAFMLMAETSDLGNKKHNPGEPLHHARGKSMDHGDCIVRHTMDVEDIIAAFERGEPQTPESLKQLRLELGQLVWRAALRAQELAEKYLGAPLAPGARLPVGEPKPGTVTTICGHVNPHGAPYRCTLPPGHTAPHLDVKAGAAWHDV